MNGTTQDTFYRRGRGEIGGWRVQYIKPPFYFQQTEIIWREKENIIITGPLPEGEKKEL